MNLLKDSAKDPKKFKYSFTALHTAGYISPMSWVPNQRVVWGSSWVSVLVTGMVDHNEWRCEWPKLLLKL